LDAIVIEVQRDLSVSADVLFDTFMPIDLTEIMTGYGPLPAVSAIETQSGPWDSVGAERTIRLADGTSMLEVITDVDRPRGFSYTLSDMTSILRLLVDRFHGSWRFLTTSTDDQSVCVQVTWRYRFDLRSRFTWPISWLILTLFWRPYMNRAFDRAIAALPDST